MLCLIQKKQLPLIRSHKKYYPGKKVSGDPVKIKSVGHQGENTSKMQNKGTQIDDIDASNVSFDRLEPPDDFVNHR